jgi:hypothetical protein
MFNINFSVVEINVAGAVVPAQYFDNFFIFFARALIVVLLA